MDIAPQPAVPRSPAFEDVRRALRRCYREDQDVELDSRLTALMLHLSIDPPDPQGAGPSGRSMLLGPVRSRAARWFRAATMKGLIRPASSSRRFRGASEPGMR